MYLPAERFWALVFYSAVITLVNWYFVAIGLGAVGGNPLSSFFHGPGIPVDQLPEPRAPIQIYINGQSPSSEVESAVIGGSCTVTVTHTVTTTLLFSASQAQQAQSSTTNTNEGGSAPDPAPKTSAAILTVTTIPPGPVITSTTLITTTAKKSEWQRFILFHNSSNEVPRVVKSRTHAGVVLIELRLRSSTWHPCCVGVHIFQHIMYL